MSIRNFGIFCIAFTIFFLPMILTRRADTPAEAAWIVGGLAGIIAVYFFREKRS